jgi:hypothetical protein
MFRLQSQFLSDLPPAHAGSLHTGDILRPDARNPGKVLRHILICLVVIIAGPFHGPGIVLIFCLFHSHGRFLDPVMCRFQFRDGRCIPLRLCYVPGRKHDGQAEKKWCT